MKKFFKPTYITLLIFILLGIFVIFVDKGKREKDEKISIFAQGVKEEDITKIELIDIEKNTDIICNKSDSGLWEIVFPERYDADKDVINGIISNFINTAVDRKLLGVPSEAGSGIELKNFGLDSPKFKIKITSKDNKENVLVAGNLTPTQNLYYVKDQYNDPVYTVYSYSIDGMRKDIKSLRNKIIIDFDIEKVEKLIVQSKSETKEFVKKENKWLIVEKPIKNNAINSEIEDVLSQIKDIRADGFPDDVPKNLSKYGLAKPEYIVKIYEADVEKTLLVGIREKSSGDLYVKTSDKTYVYSVSSSLLNSLNKKTDEFKEKEKEKEEEKTKKK